MPGSNYLEPYRNKRLNEVVIPGAHDAGIYIQAKDNVQTQTKDILAQAEAGCRFFDLRIATRQITENGVTRYEQKAYHLKDSLVKEKQIKPSPKISSNITGYQSMSRGGGWGDGLETMLKDARKFVEKILRNF